MLNLVTATSLFLAATQVSGAQSPLQVSDSLVHSGVRDPRTACSALQNLSFKPNTTILDATYHDEGLTAVFIPEVCQCTSPVFNFDGTHVTVPLCRVQFKVDTSETSSVTAEVWLPDNWNRRFLAVGNGGTGGCIDYQSLEYGASLGFATVASNNGHDGATGLPFYNNPEVVNDFAHRAIHVQTLLGKEISQVFYGETHEKAYYLGCSTGGRQGFMSAMRYPDDFDGIVAGAPAVNFNLLTGFDAMLSLYIGAPHAQEHPSFISRKKWEIVAEEILRQCDGIDGVKDGFIAEPDLCDFKPEVLLCGNSQRESTDCLSSAQVEALNKIYSPLYGSDGNILFPRYDPGAEYSLRSILTKFSGNVFGVADDWYKYVVYKDPTYNFSNFGIKDVEFGAKMDPGGISTYNGDLSAFETRGGKLLTFHGRSDELIPSGNSKALYEHVSRTLNLPSLDHFYRLFLVPGLDHCFPGLGATNFNQHPVSLGPEATRNWSSHNILLALMEWVENGTAPDVIIGTSAAGVERKHCRYPWRSVWNNDTSEFDCVFCLRQ